MSERGSPSTNLAVRLADEGIPLAAIARVTNRRLEDVRLIVSGAVANGLIGAMPSDEWPEGSLVAARVPTILPAVVAGVDQLAMRAQSEFKLQPTEARFLAALLLHERLSRRSILAIISDRKPVSPQSLDVFATHVRSALALLSVDVSVVWGRGFLIEADGRRRVLEHLNWPPLRANPP